jgi:hypothetical protein
VYDFAKKMNLNPIQRSNPTFVEIVGKFEVPFDWVLLFRACHRGNFIARFLTEEGYITYFTIEPTTPEDLEIMKSYIHTMNLKFSWMPWDTNEKENLNESSYWYCTKGMKGECLSIPKFSDN